MDRAMLYSVAALDIVGEARFRFGCLLRQRALDLAARDGRDVVTEGDVREAVKGVDPAGLFNEPDGDPGEGR